MSTPQEPDADRAFLATLTLLYVEDDAVLREQFAHFLGRRVGRLLQAPNGAVALEMFKAERPALVITDIQMPRMDGLTLASEIHRVDASVPIVVVTAFEQVDHLHRAIEAGVDKYVTKPVDTAKLEAALLACARRLRGDALLANERKAQLEHARLHEREVVGLLAGGMAHDFNNLLQALLGNLSLAAPMVAVGTELRELMDDALDVTQQAAGLGRRLVTLSDGWVARPLTGQLAPTLLGGIKDALGGCEVAVKVDVAQGLPPLVFDAVLMRQAFAQLAQNAREAMHGSGSLSVHAAQRDVAATEVEQLAPGSYVVVRFQDAGPGMEPATLEKVFDPYFSTKPRGSTRGMGLGLSICRAIIRKHQGEVTASSTPGHGATFTVFLPTFSQEPTA